MMPDNPYQSPASIPRNISPAAKHPAAKSAKLGGFVLTVLVLDALPCLIRLFVIFHDIVSGQASYSYSHNLVDFFFLYGFMAGISFCSFVGNALLFLKRTAGIPLAFAGNCLVVIYDCIALWNYWNDPEPRLIITATLSIRIVWFIFYIVILRSAAKRLARPNEGNEGDNAFTGESVNQ